MMPITATPYTTPCIPGSTLPSCAFKISASGISMAAPISGPQTVATPPNSVTIRRLGRHEQAEDRFRRHDQQHAGVEAARGGGQGAAERQPGDLPAPGVQARRLRRHLVLPGRHQGQTEPGVLDGDEAERRDQQQPHGNEGIVVRVSELHEGRRMLTAYRQRHFLQPQVLQHVLEQERIGEHGKREVMTAQAQHGQPDDEAREPADGGAQGDAEPRRQPGIHQA